jgi:hypothetical protein
MIAVVGFMLDSTTTIKRCSNGTPTGSSSTVGDYLKLMSNCYGNSSAGATPLTFFPDTHDKLIQTYNEALETICTDNMNNATVTACNYLPTTGLTEGKQGQIKDQFAFSTFNNWNVCKNSVDLMGKHLWSNTHPTAGMYVSLIGNRGYLPPSDVDGNGDYLQVEYPDPANCNCQCSYVPWDHNFGGIETAKDFSFTDGRERRLVLKVGGNIVKGKADFSKAGEDLSKCGSSTIGGTQRGLGDVNGEEDRARFVSEEGSLVISEKTGLALTVTREIVRPIFERVYYIPPNSSLYDITIRLGKKGDGGRHKIRIEQFPADFKKTALKFNHEISQAERDIIFTEDLNCSSIKGTADNPLTIEDFSGFVGGNGELVYGDDNESERYTTSGADEMLANVPYGVCLAEVTLQEGATTIVNGADVWTTTEILFTEDFESETAVN